MEPHFLHNFFSTGIFKPADLQVIIPKFKRVEFVKNDYLLTAGKTAPHYWLVQSGYIRSFAINTNGDEISTDFYTAGDIAIDWPSFFLRTPTREYMQALTDCVCWQLDFDTFQQLFHSIESFREQGRTRLVGSYFALKSYSIAMIADQAKDRYRQLLQKKPGIIQNVPLKYIATYLGITDTSLSRIRKEIAKE